MTRARPSVKGGSLCGAGVLRESVSLAKAHCAKAPKNPTPSRLIAPSANLSGIRLTADGLIRWAFGRICSPWLVSGSRIGRQRLIRGAWLVFLMLDLMHGGSPHAKYNRNRVRNGTDDPVNFEGIRSKTKFFTRRNEARKRSVG
jgi:hypothetical protein